MRNSTLFKKALGLGLVLKYIDIETSPMLLWGYGLFNQNFSIEQIEESGQITSICILKEGDKEVYSKGWDFSDGKGCDKDLLIESSNKLKDADIIIAQNGDSFDIKWLQWRLNGHSLESLKNLLTLDTLKMSKKVFRPPSHKLDFRSKEYGFGGKIDQTFKDIIAVAKGDKKKQELRIRYNVKDVVDMRKIFWRELDYYDLPAKVLNVLNRFVKETRPFCMKCAVRRQRRFEVSRKKIKHTFKHVCNNCGHMWSRKK